MGKKKRWLALGMCAAAAALKADAPSPDNGTAAIMDFFQEENKVATATKYSVDIKDAPASVQIITAADIERFGYSNVADALKGLTGLFVENDRNYQYLGVRGVDILGDYGNRVLILVDGNAVNDPVWGQAVIGNEGSVDISQVKRIEVVMGPGSAIYGSHAMLAVVNIITKDAADINGVRAEAGYGSFNTRWADVLTGQKTRSGLEYVVGGALMDSDGENVQYPDAAVAGDNGGLFNGADGEHAGKALLKLGWKDWKFEATYVDRVKDMPTTAYQTDFNDPNSNSDDGGWMARIKWDHSVTDNLDVSADVYTRRCWYFGHFDEYSLGNGLANQMSDAYWGGAEAQVDWRLGYNNHLTFGGEYVNDWDMHLKDSSSVYGSLMDTTDSMEVASAYAQDIWHPWEPLSFIGGLRYDHYSTSGDALSPRLGALVDLPGQNTVKLLYGTAFNAPNGTELYWNDQTSEANNPNLSPERQQTYEVVLENNASRHLTATLSGYYDSIKDMVTWVNDPENASLIYPVNAQEVFTRGADLTLKSEFFGMKATAGFSYQNTIDTSNDEVVPNSAPDTGHWSLLVPFWQRKMNVALEGTYTGFREESGGGYLDPSMLTDFTWTTKGLIPYADLTLKVRNLFDVPYAVPMTELPAEVSEAPGSPRTFEGKVTLTF